MAAALFNLAYVYTPLHQWPTGFPPRRAARSCGRPPRAWRGRVPVARGGSWDAPAGGRTWPVEQAG